MELAQTRSTSAGIDNPDDENSLPGLSIEEVSLESPEIKRDQEINFDNKIDLPEILNDDDNDDDDDDALLVASVKDLDPIAPPNKKIKQ